ncbi:MAG: gliding motility-associated ABC transporter substrate-binding protein GldG [Lutimonas sp.]
MKKASLHILIAFGLVLVVNLLGSAVYERFDLTRDNRYTLSDETISLVESLKEPIIVKVYLQGDFPSEFKRLQAETDQLLEELSAINDQIVYRFIDPLSNPKELIDKGLQPSRLTVQEGGKVSEAVIFPWAVVSYQGKEENVSLLVNSVAENQEKQLQNSIENLEYEFAHAFAKIREDKNKKIAVLKGNGELDDLHLYSFLKKLGEYYHLAAFTLDSAETDPAATLSQLKGYDMALVAKPTIPFSEEEKFLLDQYLMGGGKTMWLIDNVHAEMDSLMTSGQSLAYNRDLGLTDLFFSYGVRINYNVTKDLYSSTIRLASGNTGNQVQYQDFVWPYFPLVFTDDQHPVTKNIDPVRLKFPSSMDTLQNGLKKRVLLSSSANGRIVGTPTPVALDEIAQQIDRNEFNDSAVPFGVLVEGEFTSAYASRIKPFDYPEAVETSPMTKLMVISDGDIAANEVYRGEPLPLDKDKWTQQPYGNLSFLLNATHYLLDENGIIRLRAKSLELQFLDKERAYSERGRWQIINLVLPLVLLLLLSVLFRMIRIKRYAR